MKDSLEGFKLIEQKSGYEGILEIDYKVQMLDPLSLDSFLVNQLPSLNGEGNTQGLVDIIDSLDLRPERLSSFSLEESLAAVRDLNMILSSLRRHGRNLGKNSKIEQALIFLSKKTQEVPTDTVFSYGTRNPQNERMRTFTELQEERLFIESFRSGMISLPSAIKALEEATSLSLSDIAFGEKIKSAQKSFEKMIGAIVGVQRNITPELFTTQLRPFFEPKNIGGTTYKAPGGAQMPIVLIDQLLWGSDVKDEIYRQYFYENVQYQPVFLRQKAELFSNIPSLIHRITKELETVDTRNTTELKIIKSSLVAVYDLLSFVEKFRKPHLKIAEANMALRPSGSVGSGGYDVNILKFLLGHVVEAKKTISDELAKINI